MFAGHPTPVFRGVGDPVCEAFIGSEAASPISFTDTFNPADVLFDGQSNASCVGNNTTDTVSGQSGIACESLTWTHVLGGFDPATDSLSSAWLTLTVRNDSGTNNQSDNFDIVLDLLQIGDTSVPDSTVSTSLTFTSANGNHSFYFEQSVLTAEGTRLDQEALAPVPVPEPASLMFARNGAVRGRRCCPSAAREEVVAGSGGIHTEAPRAPRKPMESQCLGASVWFLR